jgi:hypothetical protein
MRIGWRGGRFSNKDKDLTVQPSETGRLNVANGARRPHSLHP